MRVHLCWSVTVAFVVLAACTQKHPGEFGSACGDGLPACSEGLVCDEAVCVVGSGGSCSEKQTCAKAFTCVSSICTPQCSDGIDNDEDGLTDWQLDLGCTGPEDSTEGGLSNALENGWTVFEKNPDTDVFYVSSSTGNDSWSGKAPEWNGTDGPVKTVAVGLRKLKDGKPDWLLFKRGDTWIDEPINNLSVSGRAEDAPFILATYGDSTQRARFELTKGDWLITHGGGSASPNRSHVRIIGMHVVMAGKDPDDPRFNGQGGSCIQWLRDGGDVLIEDLRCDYAQLNLQSNPTLPFTVRRSVFNSNYSLGSHAQSMFTSIAAPLFVEENVFHHGGWSEVFRLALWSPNQDVAAWAAVSNGQFGIDLNKNHYDIDGVDLAGVTSLVEVAARVETAINSKVGASTVELRYTQGGAFQLRAPTLPVGPDYGITPYAGTASGTDLLPLFNTTAQGVPESTIFNRNMYLSHGHGHTTVRGNIDALGASGGVQERMGGINEGNLFLDDPLSIVYGSSENDPDVDVSGAIRDNVILGGRNISTQIQGTGIIINSYATLSVGDGGTSLVNGLEVSGNIVAHNVNGTGNIGGIILSGNGPHRNMELARNTLYDWARPTWTEPKDQRAYGLKLNVVAGTSDVRIHDNVLQQPNGGFLVGADTAAPTGVSLERNVYWSFAPDPPDVWSRGWFQIKSSVPMSSWVTQTGEKDAIVEQVKFVDANRDISTYMTSQGGTPTVEAFMAEALKQSKYNWRPEYTAASVNAYIRAGFERSP